MIVIIDYGVGNLGSIRNMLKKIGHSSEISSDPEVIKNAEKLILPGVGAFDAGMSKLNETGLVALLHQKVMEEKTPTLGICLGMQLMTKGSEEGQEAGLGWVDAQCVRFRFDEGKKLKVPHMGWNYVHAQKEHALFDGMFEAPRFYFVHSFHLQCNNAQDVFLTANYGYDFTASFVVDNVMGVQFHPEKSHKFGMQILKNFATYVAS